MTFIAKGGFDRGLLDMHASEDYIIVSLVLLYLTQHQGVPGFLIVDAQGLIDKFPCFDHTRDNIYGSVACRLILSYPA